MHAISLSSGADLVKAAKIAFSETLAKGKLWKFASRYQLQRAGLLEASGAIYITFGSNGDINPDISRGTIVRYDAATLAPLTGQLTDKLQWKASPYYLSSIWQSGYAPAADSNGDIYFSTGNSNPSRASYSKLFNRPDSMIHLSADLTTLLDSFTPSNYFSLDRVDADLGSGGMMLLPDQPGSIPHIAVAGGKDGRAFLLNRDDLGGYVKTGSDRVLQTVSMGGCWCGPAHFVGSEGALHVLTGGGNGITSWKLTTTPSPQLTRESSTGSGPVNGLPDNGGSIPVISSNGTTANTAIVWFVQRPATSSDQDPGTPVTLQAFSGTDLTQQLFSAPAGTWRHAVNSNANLVPTVANGKVYVASNKQLQIFGLLGQQGAARATIPESLKPSAPDAIQCPAEIAALSAVGGLPGATHQLTGRVCKVEGSHLQLALRSGHSIEVDVSGAFSEHRPVLLSPGRTVRIQATIDAKGEAHAQKVFPSHDISPITPPDR